MTPDDRAAVEVAERYADGLASADELRATERRATLYRDVDEEEPEPEDQPPSHWCAVAAWGVTAGRVIVRAGDVCDATRRVAGDRSGEWEEVAQARLLRCVLGNPYRPVSVRPSWLTPGVVALAGAVYADRGFDRLPQLADALRDAGCDDADILGHCRQPGEHGRGCWVIDLILGKA